MVSKSTIYKQNFFCFFLCITMSSPIYFDIFQNDAEVLEKQQQKIQQRHEEKQRFLIQLEETVKSRQAKYTIQKTRKEAEAKVREEAERKRVVEKKKKKRTLKYFQQFWDKILEKDVTLLEDVEESQIVEPKYKKAPLGNNVDHKPSKKTKGKQLARYRGDIGIKMGGANPCERCVHAEQNCIVYNSR